MIARSSPGGSSPARDSTRPRGDVTARRARTDSDGGDQRDPQTTTLMASASKTDPPTARISPPPPGAPFPTGGDRLAPPSRRLFAALALTALVLLHLTNPAAWGAFPGVLAPAAGP